MTIKSIHVSNHKLLDEGVLSANGWGEFVEKFKCVINILGSWVSANSHNGLSLSTLNWFMPGSTNHLVVASILRVWQSDSGNSCYLMLLFSQRLGKQLPLFKRIFLHTKSKITKLIYTNNKQNWGRKFSVLKFYTPDEIINFNKSWPSLIFFLHSPKQS